MTNKKEPSTPNSSRTGQSHHGEVKSSVDGASRMKPVIPTGNGGDDGKEKSK